MEIFNQSINLLEKAMDLRMENQRIIAANLANIDTPGYRAQHLDFKASMEKALRQVEEPAVIGPSDEAGITMDGNNVNLENELSSMSQNRILYSVSSLLTGVDKAIATGTIGTFARSAIFTEPPRPKRRSW